MAKQWRPHFSKSPWLQGEANYYRFVKKHWFLCDRQNLEFQPGLSLTKDVKTPNSVCGKIKNARKILPRRATELSRLQTDAFEQRRFSRDNEKVHHFDGSGIDDTFGGREATGNSLVTTRRSRIEHQGPKSAPKITKN